MCGIVGIFTTRDPTTAEAGIRRMVDAGRHRGPDDTGYARVDAAGASLFLGHNRLSIIDLSEAGHQPMEDPATKSWIVYNGEIYNYRELRRELEGVGARFSSESDTEVLLRLLLEHGVEALQKLRGMYAFGFWDGRRQELLLARDPRGIKPLYYAALPGLFLFGSEVKMLQASGAASFTLNRAAMQSFLNYGAVIRPMTVLNEVRELPPGSCLRVTKDLEVRPPEKFRSLPIDTLDPGRLDGPGFPENVERMRYALTDSVKAHLVSDVPVGIALSGGIDSSLLTLLIPVDQPGIRLLTVGFDEKEFSEVKYARLVADKRPWEHHIILVRPKELEGLLGKALSSMDQPTVDGINTFVLCHQAGSQGIKVLLSGLGGDELFGGYTTFRNVPLLHRYRGLLPAISRLMLGLGAPPFGKWHKIRGMARTRSQVEAYLLHRAIRWTGAADPLLPGESPPEEFGVPDLVLSELKDAEGADGFRGVAALEMLFYMSNQLLRDSDVFSMASSVELRVPFVDMDVIRAALQIPSIHHMRFSRGKRITRSILAELCPELPLGRRKAGFTFPWESWLRQGMKGPVYGLLHEKGLYDDLGLDAEKGRHLMAGFLRGDPIVTWFQVWSLFVLLSWHSRQKAFT